MLVTPSNFDPRKTWPVLVICSTSDFKRQNRNDLVDFYRRVGVAEGWVLLAGDGPQPARNDTAAWRGAMTLAAISALHQDRKSTRLNSSHLGISYAVFCLKK